MTNPAEGRRDAEQFRVADEDLDDLASTLARTLAEVRSHGVILDRLSSEVDPGPASAEDNQPDLPASVFILALGGAAYDTQLTALSEWVDRLLLPVYGREISTSRPWCHEWYEHPEAVARLHGLWLAWQQLTDPQAGPSGLSTWHRDHLDQAMYQLRAPDGPFAACTTNPNRPSHRLLPSPASRNPLGENP